MKKTILMLTVVVGSALSMYGQGRFNFNNLTVLSGSDPSPVTVAAAHQAVGGGTTGQAIGSEYSAQVSWVPGTVAVESTVAAGSSSTTAFFGATGGGPTTDGAGLFDGGVVAVGGAAGTYTFLVRAWFNNGQFATYDAAVAGLKNTGKTPLFQLNVTATPTPAPTTVFQPFTVGVPEPSTFALAGLGAASLLLFRRRK